eukprot:TRINITY_DN44129_c0_g1_i1.p1 TRINITY_DN44129_c0_g1~~TRINITY_DN44129_c0_g1_i1.p1  ORF type:complete len:257 (-),score=43.14 TRINITY_DN44129_c0_g1_i1:1-771(-)
MLSSLTGRLLPAFRRSCAPLSRCITTNSPNWEGLIHNPNGKEATLIWLHGLGDAELGMFHTFSHINIPDMRVVFPMAPVRPITVNSGMEAVAWYDIKSMKKTVPPNMEHVEESYREIDELIKDEVAMQDGDYSKVTLAGFSMGGAMALYTGLQQPEQLGKIIVASGYALEKDGKIPVSEAYKDKTEILWTHGHEDDMVPFTHAVASINRLNEEAGVKVDLVETAHGGHDISPVAFLRILQALPLEAARSAVARMYY